MQRRNLTVIIHPKFNMKKLLLIPLFIAVLMFCFACNKAPQTIVLFNGKDLNDWEVHLKEPAENIWMVKDGNLYTTGNPWGYLATKESFSNYKLHVEWRYIPGLPITAKRHNSGVFLHTSTDHAPADWPECFEAQLASELAGAVICMGGTSTNELAASLAAGGKGISVPRYDGVSEHPLGEWNSYDIVCDDDTITLYVNGVLANKATGISKTSGRISLQSEGAAIEFRNVVLEPLGK